MKETQWSTELQSRWRADCDPPQYKRPATNPTGSHDTTYMKFPSQQHCGGRDGEAGLRVTAMENSAPAGSQTDCTREHVKNHGIAIFHGKAECYINVISAVLLKESAGQQWKC